MTGDLYDLSGKKVSSPSSQPFFFFFPLPFLILFWTMHTKMKFVCCADGVRLYSSQHILLLSLFAGAFQTPFFFFFFSLSLSSHLFSLYTPFHWMFYHYYYFVFFFRFFSFVRIAGRFWRRTRTGRDDVIKTIGCHSHEVSLHRAPYSKKKIVK